MKRIMMNKYGFERWPEEDFSDDGNRFTCYKVGNRVRVSKLVADGQAYISARIDGIKLPYEVYSQLPHYKVLDDLNGVSVDSIDEDDLLELYHACVEYEQEYDAAEANLDLPSMAAIKAQCSLIRDNLNRQLKEADSMIKANLTQLITNLSNYKWESIKTYYNNLLAELERVDTYPARLYNTAQSIAFCDSSSSYLNDSYYYERILEIIGQAIN